MEEVTIKCEACKKLFEVLAGEEWRFMCVDCFKKYIVPVRQEKQGISITRNNWKQLTKFGRQKDSDENGSSSL